jgi:archaellum component FlaG (FlaF/FlaG flagellin family)
LNQVISRGGSRQLYLIGASKMTGAAESYARHHTQKMQKRLQETMDHLRRDIEIIDDPKLKAMFETSAEVLGGLVKAFQDYERKNESAWR